MFWRTLRFLLLTLGIVSLTPVATAGETFEFAGYAQQDPGEAAISDFTTLGDFLKEAHRRTGKVFAIHASNGQMAYGFEQTRLSLIGDKEVRDADFYAYFQSVLVANGFALAAVGKDREEVMVVVYKVPPNRPVLIGGAQFIQVEDLQKFQTQPAVWVQTIYPLQYQDSGAVATTLRNFLSSNDPFAVEVTHSARNNSLILAGFGAQLSKVVELVRTLDTDVAQEDQAKKSNEVESQTQNFIREMDGMFVLDFSDSEVDLHTFIEVSRELLGKNFVLDPHHWQSHVNGNSPVGMLGEKRVAVDNYYKFFQEMMKIHGIACSPVGEADTELVVLTPISHNTRAAIRDRMQIVSLDRLDEYRDQPGVFIGTTLPLQYADAQNLGINMRSALSSGNHQDNIMPLQQANALWIQGYGPFVLDLVAAIRDVDALLGSEAKNSQ